MWAQNIPKLFFSSVIGGALCGALWTLFYITRLFLNKGNDGKSRRTATVVEFFEDLVFGVVCGCVMSVVIYCGNNGKFRLPALVGAFVGFVAYKATLGALTVKLAKIIFGISCAVFEKICVGVRETIFFIRKHF
jgi:hypothetical protein